MAVTRVALQAALAQLAAGKIFADANGLLIAHAGIKVGTFSRDSTLSAGNQSITGVGFTPVGIIAFALVEGVTTQQISWGIDDGSSPRCMYFYGSGSSGSNPFLVQIEAATNVYSRFKISSWDSDGFTGAWTKSGSPTGSINVTYIAFR